MRPNLTKRDLVLRMCKSTGMDPKEARKALETVLTSIQLALVNGKYVELRNFGTLEVCIHKSRIGRNPQHPNKPIVIPDHAVIKFRPGQSLKKQLKNLNVKDLQRLL
ncbi:MAG: HU family DNA-binding protein [Puniceicoccales bacterium]|jgi:nucleoid DNA-binding protein|nr:HU family DNA-binding protein [Puniceicoccales bacterium]